VTSFADIFPSRFEEKHVKDLLDEQVVEEEEQQQKETSTSSRTDVSTVVVLIHGTHTATGRQKKTSPKSSGAHKSLGSRFHYRKTSSAV
jgi:hypothetical protein